MRKKILTLFAVCMAFVSAANAQTATETEKSKVYFTSDISPESLVKIYNALGKEATGKVAVKISTGESSQSNHLRPELIGQLVKDVKGTLVECNTAYGGNRSNTTNHRRAIEERGYGDIAICRICDAWQCKRCIWLNYTLTEELNIPSYQQCIISHIERRASSQLLNLLKEHDTDKYGKYSIKTINYLDPFELVKK